MSAQRVTALHIDESPWKPESSCDTSQVDGRGPALRPRLTIIWRAAHARMQAGAQARPAPNDDSWAGPAPPAPPPPRTTLEGQAATRHIYAAVSVQRPRPSLSVQCHYHCIQPAKSAQMQLGAHPCRRPASPPPQLHRCRRRLRQQCSAAAACRGHQQSPLETVRCCDTAGLHVSCMLQVTGTRAHLVSHQGASIVSGRAGVHATLRRQYTVSVVLIRSFG